MLFSDWHSYDHYGLAFVAFFGTLAAVFLIQWVMMRSRWAGWMQSLQGVAPPFMNALGVLFGLVLAFLANDTWSAHDRAMSAVYREADGLRSIGALAATVPEPLGSELRTAAAAYARASAAEWTELARRREAPEVLARADALLALLAAPAVLAVRVAHVVFRQQHHVAVHILARRGLDPGGSFRLHKAHPQVFIAQ